MAKIVKGNDVLGVFPVDASSAAEHFQYALEQGAEVILSPSEVKAHVRREIETAAGDLASLVGTVSDGSGLLLEQVARAFVGLAAASSLADVRAAVADAAALLQPLLDQIDAGAVVLPHHVKGAETVLGDVAARSTTVSNVLIAAAGE